MNKMADLLLFFENQNNTLTFKEFDEDVGLPFPIYFPLIFKLPISVSLFLCLFYGLKLRKVIFKYLKSPELKLGPINHLIWMDQTNGLLLSFVIVVRIVTIHSTVPLVQLFGPHFGPIVNSLTCIYLIGSCFWSFCISIYRIDYVLSQGTFIDRCGEMKLTKVLVFAGTGFVLSVGIVLNIFDDRGSITKACFHHSKADLEIIYAYQVKNFSSK